MEQNNEYYLVKIKEIQEKSKNFYNLKLSYMSENIPRTLKDFYSNIDVPKSKISNFLEGQEYVLSFGVWNYKKENGQIISSTRFLEDIFSADKAKEIFSF